MATLQPSKLVYYHPLDSFVDADAATWVQSVVWASAASFATSGKIGTAYSAAGTSAIHSPAYAPFGASDTRWTAALWVNYTATLNVWVGFEDNSTGLPEQAIQLVSSPTAAHIYLGNEVVFTASITLPGIFSVGASAWHLIVLDLERSGTDYTLRHSVDGSPFTAESPAAGGSVWTGSAPGVIAHGGTTDVDEVALWRNADLFTTSELENLFDLANAFGEGMDQYSEQYLAPICWQATAVMPGGGVWRDSGSGPCPPVIRVPKGARDIVVTDDGVNADPRIQEG